MNNIDKACEQALKNLKKFISDAVSDHKSEIRVQFHYLRMAPDERKEWAGWRYQEHWEKSPLMRRAMTAIIAETGGAA